MCVADNQKVWKNFLFVAERGFPTAPNFAASIRLTWCMGDGGGEVGPREAGGGLGRAGTLKIYAIDAVSFQ